MVTLHVTSDHHNVLLFADLAHIMISYQWDVKPEVLEFRELLKEEGYRVWIDVEQMHKGS